MKTFKQFSESDDYKGQHEAPDPQGGAHMHDLTHNGIYPKDVYQGRAHEYTSDSSEGNSMYKAVSKKDKPFSRMAIYRAVPKDRKITKINPGDWVTHNRDYAMEHGRSNLGSKKYKILSTMAHARDLFTDGNSIHEWGYHPQPMTDKDHADKAAYMDKVRNSPEALARKAHFDGIRASSKDLMDRLNKITPESMADELNKNLGRTKK